MMHLLYQIVFLTCYGMFVDLALTAIQTRKSFREEAETPLNDALLDRSAPENDDTSRFLQVDQRDLSLPSKGVSVEASDRQPLTLPLDGNNDLLSDGESLGHSEEQTKKYASFDVESTLQLDLPLVPSFVETSAPELFFLFAICFDGGSRGNPGTSGAGATLECVLSASTPHSSTTRTQVEKRKLRKYLGDSFTNNQAEFEGAIVGLQEALTVINESKAKYSVVGPKNCHVTVLLQGDSKLVVNILKGDFRCKSKNLLPLFSEAQKIVSALEGISTLDLAYQHIYREFNSVADGKKSKSLSFNLALVQGI